MSLSTFFIFFFNDTSTTEIYTLSLHDALPIAREAAFSGAAVKRLGDDVDRPVPVGVGHHDHEILGAAERLDALARVSRATPYRPGDRRRSDERHGADLGVVADRLDDLPASVDQIDDSGRQVAFLEKPKDQSLRKGHLLGGFDDDRVARSDGERQEPEGNHRGEVERRDGRANADRLPDHLAVDSRGDVLETVTHHEGRGSAGNLDALDPPPDAAP